MAYLVVLGIMVLFGAVVLLVGTVVRPQTRRVANMLSQVRHQKPTRRQRFPSPLDKSWSGPGWQYHVTYEDQSCSIEGPGLPTVRFEWSPGGRWPPAKLVRRGFPVCIAGAKLELRRPTYGLRRRRRAVLVTHPEGTTWEIRAWDALAVALLRSDDTPLAVFPFGSPWLIRPDAHPTEIGLAVAIHEMELEPRVHLLGNVIGIIGVGH